jgi:hypothetical protein
MHQMPNLCTWNELMNQIYNIRKKIKKHTKRNQTNKIISNNLTLIHDDYEKASKITSIRH